MIYYAAAAVDKQGREMRKMLMIACLLSLATMYGCNKAPTPEERAEQWRKAAEQGNVTAQFILGACYDNGEGVTEDKIEAAKWYRKAAEQGLEVAELVLKRLEQRGGTAP